MEDQDRERAGSNQPDVEGHRAGMNRAGMNETDEPKADEPAESEDAEVEGHKLTPRAGSNRPAI